MRNLIISSILELMSQDDDIFFLTADMGINLVEPIQERYPDRFLNVGIAEQNLIGVSAGLANLGFRPFAYTISNFIIHRCLEQIRNDISLHNYPVTLIGTSTGFDNAPLGPTHHVIDDWGMLRSFSNFRIYCPSSTTFSKGLIAKVLSERSPTYIRVPKGGPEFPDSDEDIVEVGSEDSEIVLVSYGGLVQECLQVHEIMPEVSVLVINRLFPLDEVRILDFLNKRKHILVVEDHVPSSGLFGALSELFVRRGITITMYCYGPRGFSLDVGSSSAYYHEKFGLNSRALLERCRILNEYK